MADSLRGWSSLVLLGVLGLSPAFAQTPTFSGSADVVAVEVPVQVLRDGEPVRGLKAEDFEIFEGRRKLPLTGFEVLDLQAPDADWKAARAISARRHFLLLFDLGFAAPKGLDKAKAAARDMLLDLHPADLMAVAAYLPSAGPQLLLGFTTDRQQVEQALEMLSKVEMANRVADPLRLVVGFETGGGGGWRQPRSIDDILADLKNATNREERRELIAELKSAQRNAGFPPFLETPTETEKKAERMNHERAVTAMARAFEDLAKTTGSLYGRKYVVLFSEGFDPSIFTGTTDVDQQLRMAAASTKGAVWGVDSDKRFGNTKTAKDLESMLEEFRRADCVIHAVDIGGLREGVDPGAPWAGGRDSLFLLAESTGGDLYENHNDLSAAMEKMLRRTSVTYVLTVQPEGLKRDGAYHEIRVALKNAPRGTRIVHRPGYYAPRPFGQQSPTERLLQTARGVLSAEDLGTVKLSVLAAPFTTGTAAAYVPVLIEVDGQTLMSGTEGWSLPVEIYAYAFDDKGQARDFFSQTIGLELLKVGAPLARTGLKFFGHLDLTPGDWNVRVLVRNAASGAAGFKTVAVHVPDSGAASPVLLPAFFPEPAGKWLLVRESRQASAQVSYPFMSGDEPFIPASLPKLEPDEEAPISLVAYHLQPGEVQAEAKVRTGAGHEVGAGRIRILERNPTASGAESLSAVFAPPPCLKPGEYVLQLTLTDAAGTSSTSQAPFVVAAGGPG